MNKQIAGWLTLIVASFMHTCQADTAYVVDLTTQAPATIVIPYGQQQFTLALKANPTTGFTWVLKAYDHRQLQLLSQHYQAFNPQRIGASGVEFFHFQLKTSQNQCQQGTIRLGYERPWEKNNDSHATIVTWRYANPALNCR